MSATVRAELEEGDYVAAQRLCRAQSLWWPIAAVLLAGVLSYVAIQSYNKGNTVGLYVSLGAMAGGVIGWLVCYYWWIPFQARRVFRQQKSLQRPFQLSWDDTGIHARDEQGEYRHRWSDFLRWREGERLFVLNLSDAMFIMVPKKAFTEPGSLQEFRERLAREVR